MTFTKNRTVVLGAVVLSLILPSRALLSAPRPIDAETPPVVAEADDASDGQELQALKAAFLELRAVTSRDLLRLRFDAALQAGEKNDKAAEELVGFVVESLIFDESSFSLFRRMILEASENESSPFHRDELIEKLRDRVALSQLFADAFKTDGVAGLEKVLERRAQEIKNDPNSLAFWKTYVELLSRPEDDVLDGYNSPQLGGKLKRIVADAYLERLRSNPDLVPMSIDDFMTLLDSIKGAEDAEFADAITSIWFNVAFASAYDLRLDYRVVAPFLKYRLSLIGEEVANAFTERALESFKNADSDNDYAVASLVLGSFPQKIKEALDAGDSKGLENIVAEIVEREKGINPCAKSGGFHLALGSGSGILVWTLRGLEVARPDLARRAYDEATRLCLERGGSKSDVFNMDCASFYCESIDAIVAADLPKLERLADRIAEKAYVHAASYFPNSPKNAGEEFIFRLYQEYTWRFRLYFEGRAVEILDRAIKELNKSDKNNAKAFAQLLAKVRNVPRLK